MKKLWLKGLMSVLLLLATALFDKAGALSFDDVILNSKNATEFWGPGTFDSIKPDKNLEGSLNDSKYFGNFGGFDEFEYFGKVEENSTQLEKEPNFGITLSLFYQKDTTSQNKGNFTLSWQGSPLPVTFDLVFLLKAGDDFALYFFDNFQLTSNPTSASGTYKVSFTNNGGQYPALSHLSVFWSTRTNPARSRTRHHASLWFRDSWLGGNC